MTLEQVIDGCIQRLLKNLTTSREKKRHQKVVETETGEIVGYARWIIPRDAGIEWLDAQVVEPTEVEAQDYEKRWRDATVDGRSKGSPPMVAEMRPQLEEEEERIIKYEPHLSEFSVAIGTW
jgi:hypothetical protein